MNSTSLETLLKSPEYKNNHATIPIILGTDINNKPVIQDLHKLPHLLIGGGAGTGKTMFLKSVILSIRTTCLNTDCKITVLNPKGIDFENYSNFATIANDVDEAIVLLQNFVKEMEYRYKLFANNNVKNISEYNAIHSENKLPFKIILIDELSTMISFFGQKVEKLIVQLAEKSRATGLHLIMTSNYFDKISESLEACLPARLAFWVAYKRDAIKILGHPGAEKLATYNEALFSEIGKQNVLIHTPYIEGSKAII